MLIIARARANIRWRFHFGDGGSVRDVSLIRVRDGRIVEALAYGKHLVSWRRYRSDRCTRPVARQVR
jgi:ketosteroid isomerase-like protein